MLASLCAAHVRRCSHALSLILNFMPLLIPITPSFAAASSVHDAPYVNLQIRANGTRFLPSTESFYSVSSKRMIQRIIVATSTCTILLVLVTFFFFWRMQQKRLRHKLVMLSILGCFIRGLWYFLFSIVVISGKTIRSASGLCQATGFFIHVGNEMSDIATLLIAIHGALQIFRPSVSTIDVGDGLYDYQEYCFAAIALLPIILASISFVNPGPAYTAQGAFCSLPTSPIWYRIVLSYAPRYLIAGIVICLSIAVYVHIELKFRSFAKSQRASRTSIAFPSGQNPVTNTLDASPHVTEEKADDHSPQQRSESLPVLSIPDYNARSASNPISKSQSPKAPRTNSHAQPEDAIHEYFPKLTVLAAPSGRKISIATTGSRDTTSTSNKSRASLPGIATLKRTQSALQRLATPASNAAPPLTPLQAQEAERKTLRRQLRLIFVYPIVYVVLWIPPCTLNAMQYSPRYAGNLPPWLGALSNVCLTLMGGIDCIVFFWREKPWQHSRSRTSSTNLLLQNEEQKKDVEKGDDPSGGPSAARRSEQDGPSSRPKIAGTISNLLPRRPKPARSASTIAKQRALERLALEIKDRKDQARGSIDSLPSGKASVSAMESDMAEASGSSRTVVKQWWDRQDSVSAW